MKKININVSRGKIKDFLFCRIDRSNPVEVERVGRYIKYDEMFRQDERKVKEEGVSVTTGNCSQKFIKSQHLLNEMNRINGSLLSIENSFNFLEEEETHSADDLL